MANLINLFLDKDTGELVAKERSFPTNTLEVVGFRYTQVDEATTWNIGHAAGSEVASVQIYDENGQLIIPDSVTIVGPFSIQVVFASPQAGTAHVFVAITS